jgi:hypothetical protein
MASSITENGIDSPTAACIVEPNHTTRSSFEELSKSETIKQLTAQLQITNTKDSAISLGVGLKMDSPADPSASAMNIDFAARTQENEKDIAYYYEGFRGLPKLLARTNKEPFVRRWEFGFPVDKMILNIGQHPLVNEIESGIWDSILSILRGVKWLHIDVIRIGYSPEDSTPVLLISVAPGSISEQDAEIAIMQCYQLLSR